MNMKIKTAIAFFFIALSASFQAYAAAPYKVSGTVKDSISKESEPMATLIVTGPAADSIVRSTDTEGRFEISLPASGKYSLRIVSIGRKEKTVEFHLTEENPSADLGTIYVENDADFLEAATVSAQVPFIKTEVDKLTYKISEDPDAQTSNALDMLRKVPRVTVDADDNIMVNGQGNFKIYVNGKPSGMFSSQPGKILKGMPAESIKRVEVISDPGAKYDAEGVGGILNIVMNAKRADGYNVSINAGGGNRSANAVAYGAVKLGKFSVSANYGFNYMKNPEISVQSERKFTSSGTAMQSSSEQMITNEAPMHFGSIEMSYDIDSLNLLTLSGNLYLADISADYNIGNSMYSGSLIYSYRQTGTAATLAGSGSVSIDWQHLFRKHPGEMLTVSYMYSNSPSGLNSEYALDAFEGNRQMIDIFDRTSITNRASSQEHTGQVDYVRPFAEKHKIEAGAKYILRLNGSEGQNLIMNDGDNGWTENPEYPSQSYRHEQHIIALYADWSANIGQFGFKAGIRAEETLQRIGFTAPQEQRFNSEFTDIVPSASILWTPKPTESLQLTYNMRISRPGITYLNPFVQSIGSSEITYGDPDIVSEKNHTVALNYSLFDMKYGLNASLRYSFTNNSISSFQFIDSDGVLNNTYGNIGKNRNAGLMAYAYWNPTQNTRLFFNGNVSWISLHGNSSNKYTEGLDNEGWTGNLYLGAQQSFKYGFRLSANGGYFFPSISLQGKGYGSYFYSLALNKSFFDGKLDISLSAVNFFEAGMKMSNTTSTPYLTSTDSMVFDNRYFMIGVSYNFGNMKQIVKKAQRRIVNNDLLNTSGGTAGAAGGGTGRTNP